MRGSSNFRQGGGPIQSDKKRSDSGCFFFSPQLIYRSQMVDFKENYHFSRFMRGSNIFQGGSNIFQGGGGVQHFPGGSNLFQGGGSNCLFPIETHITCDFPGGGPDQRSMLLSSLRSSLMLFNIVFLPVAFPARPVIVHVTHSLFSLYLIMSFFLTFTCLSLSLSTSVFMLGILAFC